MASLATPLLLFADSPDETYVTAYRSFMDGQNLEKEAKPRAALEKYQAAEKLLLQISKAYPDYMQSALQFRLQKTQENIARLKQDISAAPADASDTAPEGSLPQQDQQPPPPQSTASNTPIVNAAETEPMRLPFNTEAARTTNDPMEAQIRELRRALAKANAENERLNEQLIQKTAALQSARVENDRTKVQLVEIKSELEDANTALANQKSDGDALTALRAQYQKRIQAVTDQLNDANADKEVLQEKNDHLLDKLNQAASYIAASDGIRKQLLTEREDLADERNKAVTRTKKLKDNSAEIEKVTAENKTLKDKLADSVPKAELEKAQDANEELTKKMAANDKKVAKTMVSREDYEKLSKQLEDAQDKMADLKKSMVTREDYDKLAKEAKAAQDKLAATQKSAVSRDEYDKLTEQAKAAQEKLAAAEKASKEATANNPEKDKQIAALQSELNSVNDKLLEAQTQVSRGDDKVKSLQKELDETSGELAELKLNPAPSKEEKAMLAENELLRKVILREIKEQSQRDEAHKAVEQEIATLKIKSDSLNQQLAILAAPPLQLTPEERGLFKDPIALIGEPSAGSMEVTMAVSKPQPPKTASASPSPQQAELTDKERDMVREAKKAFDAEKYGDAEKIYQQIVDDLPNSDFALSNLGAVQLKAGKLSAAEVALKKAISINEKDGAAYRNLGIIYSKQAKFQDAIDVLQKAIALDDSDAVAHNYLGVCEGQSGDRDNAEKELKRAVELNPSYPSAHFNLAVLYATKQPPSIDLAKHYYKKATELGAAPDPSLEHLIQ